MTDSLVHPPVHPPELATAEVKIVSAKYLADRAPGKPGRRPACGRTPNGLLLDDAAFNAVALSERCERCDSNFRGRQLELNDLSHPRPSAVASAPAIRPALTVACQSQYDPDD